MNATLSSKYQIVVPKEIREMLRLKPGQKLAFIPNGSSSVKLVRVPGIEELRGIAKGTPAFLRDKKDRAF